MPSPPSPRPADGGKTILATFAGRRDRMELLTWYARAALARGVIDEWHVWDFARQEADTAWLRGQFPSVRLTPGVGLEYFDSARQLRSGEAPDALDLRVAATNDAHIGLRRLTGNGPSYEIVLGGWSNRHSVIRAFQDPELLRRPELRGSNEFFVARADTPRLLPEWGFADVRVMVTPDGIGVAVGGRPVIALPGPIAPGSFAVMHRSGFGSNAEWRFAGEPERGAFLFKSAPPRPDKPEAPYPFYLPFYRHYTRHLPDYARDLFLKCDDDMVHIDLDGLRRFIAFRRANPQYFMLSANVVNNGVCAWFQQEHGMLPRELLDLELPPGGLCGTLWGSAEKAETLHDHFLRDPARFTNGDMGVVEWNERLSINFIGLLGADLIHVPDIMWDDEGFLSHDGRIRARKPNAIFGGFTTAHLTFVAQDRNFAHPRVIAAYADLARRAGVTP